MKVDLFDPKQHYALVASWWKAHQWPVLPLEMLPRNGFVISGENGPVCAGWLYRTDSDISWFEFVVGNPESATMERARALDLLIETVISKAKELNHPVIFSSLQHRGLMKKYQRHGFRPTDTGMTNFVWRESW